MRPTLPLFFITLGHPNAAKYDLNNSRQRMPVISGEFRVFANYDLPEPVSGLAEAGIPDGERS
jgi:hypothetical protein